MNKNNPLSKSKLQSIVQDYYIGADNFTHLTEWEIEAAARQLREVASSLDAAKAAIVKARRE